MCREKEIAKIAFAEIVKAVYDFKDANHWDEENGDQKLVDSIEIPDSIVVNKNIYRFSKKDQTTCGEKF